MGTSSLYTVGPGCTTYHPSLDERSRCIGAVVLPLLFYLVSCNRNAYPPTSFGYPGRERRNCVIPYPDRTTGEACGGVVRTSISPWHHSIPRFCPESTQKYHEALTVRLILSCARTRYVMTWRRNQTASSRDQGYSSALPLASPVFIFSILWYTNSILWILAEDPQYTN